MPKKLSPSANKNIPVNKKDTATESSELDEQLPVSGVANTAITPQTLDPTTPLADTITNQTEPSCAKIKVSQKLQAANDSLSSVSSQSQSPQKPWLVSASSERASTSRGAVSASSQAQALQQSWAASASKTPAVSSSRPTLGSRTQTPLVTQEQKIKITALLNELKQLNPKTRDDFKKFTMTIYQINALNVELNTNDKLTLIDIVSSLNLTSWLNINLVHLLISLNTCGVFNKEIPQDTEEKQAKLFKKLLEITEKIIHEPRSYKGAGLYSFLSQIIKFIATSSPSLVEENKDMIRHSLRAFLGYIEETKSVNLNADNIYHIVTSIYDLRKKDVITHQEAGILAKHYIINYDIVKELRKIRKQSIYLFTCRRLITKDGTYKNNNNRIEAIFNQAIEAINPFSSDKLEAFFILDEIDYAAKMNLIHIENCNIEPLMKFLEGKISFLVGKQLFANFYMNLYNLETTSFGKTKIYERLKQEYHACLNKNIDKIDSACITKLESYITKSKTSYFTNKELDKRVADNLELMFSRICSSTSILNRENCLASLKIFSHKMATNIHVKYFQYFKERIIPVLLNQQDKLTYHEKIQLIKVLPLTKSERNDHLCRQMINELYNCFMINTDEHMEDSVLFLDAMAGLGNFNSDIMPFIDLSRKVLVIDETRSKSELFNCLRFYSFSYAYFILQEQETTLSKKKLNSIKKEMKEKLALTINLIESQYKDNLFNDNLLMLNYGHALLKTDRCHKVNYSYTETNIQHDIYNSLAQEYKLQKGKDIQLEVSLFGLPGIDIYLNKYKLALQIDGAQHYIGADSKAVGRLSLIQKAILKINGIHLINVRELTRRRSLILEDVKQQVDVFLRPKEASNQ